MALEAGVWGKAGWLALHSHLEELLTLASCAPSLSLSDPLKFCIQCVESQLLVVITSVFVSLSTSGCMYVCVCVHAHT